MLYLNLIFIVILLIYLPWLYGLIRSLKSGAPYVPIKPQPLKALVDLAQARSGDVWIDLGSGDGRILIAACQKYPNIRGIGIEKVFAFRVLSRLNILIKGLGRRIKIVSGDFFTANVSPANIISMYLLPATSAVLLQRFKTELRPGTKVVAHRYPPSGLNFLAQDDVNKVYLAVWPQ